MTITVTCTGHIKTSLGRDVVELTDTAREISASKLIEAMRELVPDDGDAGFTAFNTLVVINEGVAFTAASNERPIRDGDSVLLVPSSHGG